MVFLFLLVIKIVSCKILSNLCRWSGKTEKPTRPLTALIILSNLQVRGVFSKTKSGKEDFTDRLTLVKGQPGCPAWWPLCHLVGMWASPWAARSGATRMWGRTQAKKDAPFTLSTQALSRPTGWVWGAGTVLLSQKSRPLLSPRRNQHPTDKEPGAPTQRTTDSRQKPFYSHKEVHSTCSLEKMQ